MRLAGQREQVADHARRMVRDGLAVGLSGNISVRAGEHVAITPTGVDVDALDAASVCVVDLDGQVTDGEMAPSSELAMHLTIYRTTSAGAVVHTHPPYATALATVADELPGVHYLVALLGGPVPVVGYATYGSQALAELVAEGLRDRSAVLLRNHGATTVGATLDDAYHRAVQLEWLCRVHHHARQLGEPRTLPAEEIGRVADQLRTYGQPPEA